MILPITRTEVRAGACPWCQAAIEVEQLHPWVEALARIASGPLTIQPDPLMRVVMALQIALTSALISGKPPAITLVVAYLREVVPEIPARIFLEATALVRHGMPPSLHGLLDELDHAFATWSPAAR